MKTFAKITTTLVVTAFTAATAMAATSPVTRKSVEKAALTAHPGTIQSARELTKDKQKVWEVKIKGKDGKLYAMDFNAKTGKEVKAAELMKTTQAAPPIRTAGTAK